MLSRSWLRTLVLPFAAAAIGCALPEAPKEPEDNSHAVSSPSDPSSNLALGGPAGGPTPSPTPGESPAPAPTPSVSGCSLPASNPANPVCTSDPGHLLPAVQAAVNRVVQTRPALFDLADSSCEDCYRVLDAGAYHAAVQQELATRGICTVSDGEEIGAKDSNASSEQFDILLASGHVRRGSGVYRGICTPAIF